MDIKPRVLITGISGYVGSWVTKYALESGDYIVRGTVRDKTNKKKMAALKEGFGDLFDQIELYSADLEDKEGLAAAVKDCDYVIHVASPLPLASSGDEEQEEKEVIQPAIRGNENILKACVGSSVKKVIVTSTALTILDHLKGPGVVEESTIAEEHKTMTAYYKSKIRAEAWARDFIQDLPKEDLTFEVCTIHPGYILGPVLFSSPPNASVMLMKMALEGKLPGLPEVYLPFSDVRTIAEAHLLALKKGKHLKRYCPNSGTYSFLELAKLISEEYNPKGYSVTTTELPATVEAVEPLFQDGAKHFVDIWGVKVEIKNDNCKEDLGMDFIEAKTSLVDMCESLIAKA